MASVYEFASLFSMVNSGNVSQATFIWYLFKLLKLYSVCIWNNHNKVEKRVHLTNDFLQRYQTSEVVCAKCYDFMSCLVQICVLCILFWSQSLLFLWRSKLKLRIEQFEPLYCARYHLKESCIYYLLTNIWFCSFQLIFLQSFVVDLNKYICQALFFCLLVQEVRMTSFFVFYFMFPKQFSTVSNFSRETETTANDELYHWNMNKIY